MPKACWCSARWRRSSSCSLARFRGGAQLLSGPAWALTSVLFFAYWLPEVVSAFDAVDRGARVARSRRSTCATCRSCGWSRPRSPMRAGAASPSAAWRSSSASGRSTRCCRRSPARARCSSAIDAIKHAISGHGMCTERRPRSVDRLSGILGPCNLKFGQMLASLSPFALYTPRQAFRRARAGACAALRSARSCCSPARARRGSSYALVLLWSGWRAARVRSACSRCSRSARSRSSCSATFVPQVAERIERTTQLASTQTKPASTPRCPGAARIWAAATCMYRTHWSTAWARAGSATRSPRAIRARAASRRGAKARRCMRTNGCWKWRAKPARSGCCCGWRAWRWLARVALCDDAAREHARPAMLALAVTAVPVQHAPGVLFDVLGRAGAAARRAVRRQPARARRRTCGSARMSRAPICRRRHHVQQRRHARCVPGEPGVLRRARRAGFGFDRRHARDREAPWRARHRASVRRLRPAEAACDRPGARTTGSCCSTPTNTSPTPGREMHRSANCTRRAPMAIACRGRNGCSGGGRTRARVRTGNCACSANRAGA